MTITVSLSPGSLFPPNHLMRNVAALVTVEDDVDPDPSVILVSIVLLD